VQRSPCRIVMLSVWLAVPEAVGSPFVSTEQVDLGDMETTASQMMDMIAAIVGALDKREIFQSIIVIRVVSTHNSG
jgi:hypothetical protein